MNMTKARRGTGGQAMTPKGWTEDRFVPCTRAVSIGGGVVYRPLRSWHSGVFAGERLEIDRGDKSGCAIRDADGRMRTAPIPYTYTHRIYWNPDAPDQTVSAFLSYPNGMGSCETYFWEAMIVGEAERYSGEDELESAIRSALGSSVAKGEK